MFGDYSHRSAVGTVSRIWALGTGWVPIPKFISIGHWWVGSLRSRHQPGSSLKEQKDTDAAKIREAIWKWNCLLAILYLPYSKWPSKGWEGKCTHLGSCLQQARKIWTSSPLKYCSIPELGWMDILEGETDLRCICRCSAVSFREVSHKMRLSGYLMSEREKSG